MKGVSLPVATWKAIHKCTLPLAPENAGRRAERIDRWGLRGAVETADSSSILFDDTFEKTRFVAELVFPRGKLILWFGLTISMKKWGTYQKNIRAARAVLLKNHCEKNEWGDLTKKDVQSGTTTFRRYQKFIIIQYNSIVFTLMLFLFGWSEWSHEIYLSFSCEHWVYPKFIVS